MYCSKYGGYVKLPDCFYIPTSHSLCVFSETLLPSDKNYQRLFTLSIGSNTNSIRFENGTETSLVNYSINLNRDTLYTPNRDEVISIGKQNICYSFDTENSIFKCKYNDNNFYTKTGVAERLSAPNNNIQCYLNNENTAYQYPREIKYNTVLLYNRALTEEEIQQNYLYEQSIQRGIEQ